MGERCYIKDDIIFIYHFYSDYGDVERVLWPVMPEAGVRVLSASFHTNPCHFAKFVQPDGG